MTALMMHSVVVAVDPRIYLAELVGEYLEARANAEDMVHSMDVRSGSQLNRRKVIEKVMGRPGKGATYSRSIYFG